MATENDNNGGAGFIRVSNREIYDGLMEVKTEVRDMRILVQNVLGENTDLRKRVKSLEIKFYGVLAGLLGALIVLLKVGIPS
jgi:hypothetical protein